MLCHFCEQDKEGLPFRCNYCGNYFCSDHRLPENHACPKVGGPKQPGYARVRGAERDAKRPRFALPAVRSNRSRFRITYPRVFSKTEEKHILLATALMILVGFGMVYGIPGVISNALLLIVFILGFAFSFIGHELAHKFFAQRHGLWAEFRTNIYGIVITAMSIILPFKFLAPGQVNVIGNGSKAVLGGIALIGPLFNIVLGWLIFSFVRVLGIGFGLASLSAFNGWLGLFNLIPFATFDGLKVFEWDKMRWAVATAASAALLIVSYFFA
jgi:Zn-dependent protease